FFVSSRRRHTRSKRDWSSDVCSSDLGQAASLLGDERLIARAAAAANVQAESPPGLALLQQQISLDQRVEPLLLAHPPEVAEDGRSEERRVGKDCGDRGAAQPQKGRGY